MRNPSTLSVYHDTWMRYAEEAEALVESHLGQFMSESLMWGLETKLRALHEVYQAEVSHLPFITIHQRGDDGVMMVVYPPRLR